MKIKYISLFLLLSLFTFSAAVEVAGHITDDTTWTPSNNPYLVTGNIFVDSGASLTILPGTQIILESAYLDNENYVNGEYFMLNGEESAAKMFWIDGRIIALGTEAEQIIFTRDNSSDFYHWGTIYFNSPTTKSEFSNCKFEYSSLICLDAANEANGTFTGEIENLSIVNCDFIDNFGGINLKLTGNIEVVDNSFQMETGMNPDWVNGIFQYVNITAEEEAPGNVLFCGNNLPDGNMLEIENCNLQFNKNDVSTVRTGADYNLSCFMSYNEFQCNYGPNSYYANLFSGFENFYMDNNNFQPDSTSSCSIGFVDGVVSNNVFNNVKLTLRNYTYTEQKLILNNYVYGNRLYVYDDFDFYNNIIDSAVLNINSARDSRYYNCYINPSAVSTTYYNDSIFQNCFIFNFGGFYNLKFKNCISTSAIPEDNSLGVNITINASDMYSIFENYYEKDYHLGEYSMAIDAGINDEILYPFELDGNYRIWDGDGNGTSLADIGPYEYGSQTSGGIQIIVYDFVTGDPVKYALAKIDGNSGQFAFTDNSGLIQYNLPSGIYDITIERMFYDEIAECQIEVYEEELTQVLVSLHSPVTDSESDIVPELNNVSLTNYPNPFNPSTTISFNLTTENTVIEIYNIKGQMVKNIVCHPEPLGSCNIEDMQKLDEGSGKNASVTWNGTDMSNNPVSSGIYFATLKSGSRVLASRKMMLLK